VGLGAALITSGCGESAIGGKVDAPSGKPVKSTFTGEPAALSNRGESFSRTESIDENSALHLDFTLQHPTKIEYEVTVTSGPPIDVFLLERDEVTSYREAKPFEYVAGGSTLRTRRGTATVVVPAGTYSIVADNTRLGEATPPADNSAGEVELSGRLRSAPGGRPVASNATETPGTFSNEFDSYSTSLRVPAGSWRSFGFTLDGPAKYEYEMAVTDGPNVDVFLLQSVEHTAFEEEQAFAYIEAGSIVDTRGGRASVVLPAGSYETVVDNGRIGVAKPPQRGVSANVDVSSRLFGA
jgi:hypothetical protein